MRIRIALPVLVLSMIVPATASAGGGLPKPDTSLITVPKSIGGVSLGQPLKKADKAWGKTGDCHGDKSFASCQYGDFNGKKGNASIEANDGEVTSFGIFANFDEKGNPYFKGPMMEFRTAEGIGLSSKASAVKKAYPEAKKIAGGSGLLVNGKGKSYMVFSTIGGKFVTSVAVGDGEHQG